MKIPKTLTVKTIPFAITVVCLLGSAYFFGKAHGIDYCIGALGL